MPAQWGELSLKVTVVLCTIVNFWLKNFLSQEEITQVYGTVHRRIIVMQCLGFLCGLLVCTFFSAMFTIMWHFYSIGESFLSCHYWITIMCTFESSGMIVGILSLYILADTLVYIPFYGTSELVTLISQLWMLSQWIFSSGIWLDHAVPILLGDCTC